MKYLLCILLLAAVAQAEPLYLCKSQQYSFAVARTRDCPGIRGKMLRALRVSLVANYIDSGLTPQQARREAARAMRTYSCGWVELRQPPCDERHCEGSSSSSSNGGGLE